MSTLSLYSTTARDAAMAAIGADTVGDQEVSLLKQIFVAAGNSSGGGGGSGNVVGPASSTDHAVARFDLATGKLLQNSVVLISDLGAMSGVSTLGMSGLLTITQATTNTGILASTGYSLTGSNATSMIDLAGTWNTTGAPKGIKLNITNTASDPASRLLDLQTDGVSRFSVNSTSTGGGWAINIGAYPIAGPIGAGVNAQYGSYTGGVFHHSDTGRWDFGPSVKLGWTADLSFNGADLTLSRRAAASLQMGLDSASPVSQTLGVAAGVGGTINGANFTIAAGAGTHTGTPGSLLFQTATVNATPSLAQSLTTRLTISQTEVVVASGISLNLGNSAVAETPTATHTLIIRDDTGADYKLLCVPN